MSLNLLGGLGPEHEGELVAVRQRVEEPAGLRVSTQRLLEVGRDVHFPWLGVELNLDVRLVAPATPAFLRMSALTPNMNAPFMNATVVRYA